MEKAPESRVRERGSGEQITDETDETICFESSGSPVTGTRDTLGTVQVQYLCTREEV